MPSEASSPCIKLLTWNCIGLSRASAIHSLRVEIRKHSPYIPFLSKTKTQHAHVIVVLNSLGFFIIFYFYFFFMSHAPPTSSKGGLLLAWRHGMDLECFSTTINTINAWCYYNPHNNPWLFTCIYGPPEKINKSYFWDSLLDVGKDYIEPWLCIGDFNMILLQSEKYGGRPYACSSNDPFHSFLDSFGMVDLGLVTLLFGLISVKTIILSRNVLIVE